MRRGGGWLPRSARRASIPALAVLGLLLSGCASDGAAAFDPALQRELIRKHHAFGAEAAATPDSLEDLLRKGDARRADGDLAGAMWSYLRAHERDPQHPAPVARIASLQIAPDPERAETLFRDLLARHPESGAAHAGLGLVDVARGDWTAGRTALEEAVRLAPSLAAAHSALGVCLDQLGLHSEARESYERAIALHPSFYEALNNLGVSYLATAEYEAAAQALRRASRTQTRDPAVFNNLGLALGRLRDYDRALSAFRRAGSEQAARNNLGYVLYLNGDYERAIREYEQAVLAGGDQRPQVLRNLRLAQRAEREQTRRGDGQGD